MGDGINCEIVERTVTVIVQFGTILYHKTAGASVLVKCNDAVLHEIPESKTKNQSEIREVYLTSVLPVLFGSAPIVD